MQTFYLGAHHPIWLERAGVPLFVSDRWLRPRATLPLASAGWALDSGGFTELSTHGTWANGSTPRQYAQRVSRYRDHIGRLDWAAPQDWMCEPHIVAKTGLSVAEHQRRTVTNYCDIRAIDDALPIVPVVQGYSADEYLECVALYESYGVRLTELPIVALGSVCRRQATNEIGEILLALRAAGLQRLHGFGVKTQGLKRYGDLLHSADSMAWSFDARRGAPLPECTHPKCNNCLRYGLLWRERLLAEVCA